MTKKNSSKIANVLKKYLKINISSKSITTAIDVILDIGGTIDELTYNFVDYICDTFRIRCPERNKKIIANLEFRRKIFECIMKIK